jgi:L-fuconolactonase
MRLVDSHVHFWDPQVLSYPWLADLPALRRPYRPADLGAAADLVAAAVFVEAGCRSDQATAELAWVETLASGWPVLAAAVAHVPLELGVAAAGAVQAVAARPLVTGVRRNVQDEPAGFMTEPRFVAGVTLLADAGLTFDACVRHHQLPELTRLVDRCPTVTFVLDHLAKPAVKDGTREPWQQQLAELAARPNVFAKLSGLTTEADWDAWQPVHVWPYLDHALQVFGPERCMFGSDWPVARLATSYERWLDVVREVLSGYPEADQQAVLAGTAARVYRLGVIEP